MFFSMPARYLLANDEDLHDHPRTAALPAGFTLSTRNYQEE